MQVARTFRLSLLSKFNGIEFPERLRGGILEKWFEYWKNVGNDYRSVFQDIRQDMRDRPKKATFIGSMMLGFVYLLRTNPEEEDFIEQMVESSNNMSRVPRNLQNQESYKHIKTIFKLHNQQKLRHQSFGIFSVIYREDYGKENSLYAAQCKYIRPTIKSYLTERVVDIGINGKYQILKRKMINYDVNNDIYKDCPLD